jgi:hypothetical protein
VSEILEILNGLKNEICPAIADERQRTILEHNFNRAIELSTVTLEEKVMYLQGKVDAYENTIGGK